MVKFLRSLRSFAAIPPFDFCVFVPFCGYSSFAPSVAAEERSGLLFNAGSFLRRNPA